MNFLKNKLLTIVLVLCLAFTIFIGLSANKGENTGTFQNVITTAVSPIQKYVNIAGQRISGLFSYVTSIGSMKTENEKLKKEVNDLKKKVVDIDKYKRQNTELESALKYKNENADKNMVAAKIVTRVGENWFYALVIDKGSNQGIKKGQYVVTGEGYVGKVKEVSANTSKVMCILDEKANIPVKISSTGDTGIASGMGVAAKDKQAKVGLIPIESKVKVGDVIVTANISSNENEIVHEGIIVGKVTKIQDEQKNLIKQLYIKPEVDFTKIENVMVIVK